MCLFVCVLSLTLSVVPWIVIVPDSKMQTLNFNFNFTVKSEKIYFGLELICFVSWGIA